MTDLQKQFMEAYANYSNTSFTLITLLASCIDPNLDPVVKQKLDELFNEAADRMEQLVEVGKTLDKKVTFPVILAN
jgi:hypothetical protein